MTHLIVRLRFSLKCLFEALNKVEGVVDEVTKTSSGVSMLGNYFNTSRNTEKIDILRKDSCF